MSYPRIPWSSAINWFVILLAHLSRRLKGELIAYQSIRRLCVCLAVCLCVCKHFQTCGPIVTKFYLNHHWGGGKAVLGFGPDRIGTLVSMATDSSLSTLAPSFLIGSSSYLQVTRTSITSRTSSKFGQIGQRTVGLAALERLEKSP